MNEKPEIWDLHNIYGFERLYQTLIADGGNGRRTSDVLYGCYLANISAFNERHGEDLEPLEPEIFFYRAKTGYSYSDPVTSFSLCEESLAPESEPDGNFDAGALFRRCNNGPKHVYICAPLRGDVEKNIEFARQRAKEVFHEGNIPVCPHLIFPPIADPADPVQDGAAMKMCKKLIDRCDEVRVYGPDWTAGMWDEIRYAGKMKVPVITDQKEIPKITHRKSPCR